MECCLVFVTAKDEEEGEKIKDALIREKLAACVKSAPVNSTYTWKGKVEKSDEVLLIIETKTPLLEKIFKRIKSLHSYGVPAISAVPLIKGNKEYLKWINEVTE